MKMTLEEARERMSANMYGYLKISRHDPYTELPDNLVIEDGLDISFSKITKLPKNLTVKGSLDARHTLITELPDDLKVEGHLDLECTSIKSLPENLTVNGYLDISGTGVKKLPNNLVVRDSLLLNNTHLSYLPDDLIVGINLIINDSDITRLSDNLVIGGYLKLDNTNIHSLPNNLIVGDDLLLDREYHLPDDLLIGGKILSKYTEGIEKVNHLHNGDYVPGRYLYADDILTHVKSKKQKGKYTYYTGKVPGRNVIFDGTYYAHCRTFKEGVQDLMFKHAKDRGSEQYNNIGIDDKVPFAEAIIMYRVITGACQQGTEMFLDSLSKKQESYTPREIIELTENQYGNEVFKRFFESSI